MKSIEVSKEKYLDHIANYPEHLYCDLIGEGYIWTDIHGKVVANSSPFYHRYYIIVSE